MAIKRSGGVTTVAVLFILGGLGGLITPALPAYWKWAEQEMSKLEARTATVVEGAKRKGFPSEDIERWEKTRDEFADQRKWYGQLVQMAGSMPTAPLWLAMALGLAGALAGIGILFLKTWGRTLALWQACASVLIIPWWSSFHPETLAILLFVTRFQELGSLAQIGFWTRILLSVAWSIFILWFFNRSSVKAQFQARHSS